MIAKSNILGLILLSFMLMHIQPLHAQADTAKAKPMANVATAQAETATSTVQKPAIWMRLDRPDTLQVQPNKKKKRKKRADIPPDTLPHTPEVDEYDPLENLRSNFTLSVWVNPLAKGDTLLHPQMGMEENGIRQAQIGFCLVPEDTLQILQNYTHTEEALRCHVHLKKRWSHLVLVYERGTPTVYLDGELLLSGTRSTLGCHPAITAEEAKATHAHDEITLYGISLNEKEVKTLFEQQYPNFHKREWDEKQ